MVGNCKDNLEYRHQRLDSHSKILIGFAIVNIFIWVLCTTVTAMILIKFYQPIRYSSLDLICTGIWASLFFGLSGIIGIAAAYENRQPILVSTIILSMLSIFCSITISGISGLLVLSSRFRSNQNVTWQILEWNLFIFGLAGFTTNLGQFIVVSVIMCKPSSCKDSGKEESSTISADTADNQQRSVALGDLNHNNRQQPTPGRLPPPPPGFIGFSGNAETRFPPAQMDVNSFNQFGYASPYPRVPLAHGNIDDPV